MGTEILVLYIENIIYFILKYNCIGKGSKIVPKFPNSQNPDNHHEHIPDYGKCFGNSVGIFIFEIPKFPFT
jgi:hypothetical protein